MYELKTLLPVFEIDVPKCMYAMKSLALNREAVSTNNTSRMKGLPAEVSGTLDWSHTDPVLMGIRQKIDKITKAQQQSAMTKLEDKQNEVIKKLQELREQLNSMRSRLNFADEKLSKSAMVQQDIKQPLRDIVVNAHPKFIPYALLALKNLWKDSFNIRVRAFMHSSIRTSPGEDCLEFQKQLTAENENSNLPGIDVTFIWKLSAEHTEMITVETMYVPIYGEVNIIRYLARVGPPAYRYDETPYSNEIDIILDICYQLVRTTTAKARQPLIQLLNNRLQKKTYFIGNQLTIADIAVCSSIKRTPDATKDITENLKTWMDRVTKIFII